MTFYDNTSLDIEAEGGRSQDQLADHKGRSIFAYNGNPRLFPRFRSTVTDSAGKPQTDAKGRSSFRYFFSQTLQQCYLMIFFRLPTLYQSRMLQVGSDSGIGSVDLHHMSTSFSAHWKPELMALPPAPGGKGNSVVVSAELIKFQAAWGVLVDELLQEWKTFNIVAALLQTSIPILLTLDGETGSDPITRTGALLSFVCAGISLFCGSVCLLRFGSMRKMPKAAKWIHEAQNNSQLIWWNCWIMLAMPLTWLAWSVILFFATMMSYTWQSSFQDVSLGSQTSAHTTLSFRITISSVLGFGILCVAALAITLSFVFGDSLDQKFMSQVEPFLPSHQEPRAETHPAQQPKGNPYVSFPVLSSQSHVQLPPAMMSSVSRHGAFSTTKLMDANSSLTLSPQLPRYVQYRGQSFLPWDTFKSELKNAFQHPSSEDIAFDHIRRWNDEVFKPNGIEAILCLEFPLDSELDHDVGTYAVYVMDLAQARADGRQKLVDMFGPLPSHLRKICFVDAIPPSVSRQRGYPLGLTLEREIVVPESPSRTSSIVGPVDKELDVPLPSDDSATKSPIVPAAIPSSPVSPQSQSQSPPPQAGPSRPSQTPRSTDRRVTTVTTTRPDGRNGKRTNSAPQVVANSRSHKTSNTTPPDGRARTRKRTDSSQKVRRK